MIDTSTFVFIFSFSSLIKASSSCLSWGFYLTSLLTSVLRDLTVQSPYKLRPFLVFVSAAISNTNFFDNIFHTTAIKQDRWVPDVFVRNILRDLQLVYKLDQYLLVMHNLFWISFFSVLQVCVSDVFCFFLKKIFLFRILLIVIMISTESKLLESASM